MSKKSPKKLDQLFRQGADQYDFEYNPESWGEMEEILEKDNRRRVVFWWMTGIASVLLMLVVAWFLVDYSAEDASVLTKEIQEESGFKRDLAGSRKEEKQFELTRELHGKTDTKITNENDGSKTKTENENLVFDKNNQVTDFSKKQNKLELENSKVPYSKTSNSGFFQKNKTNEIEKNTNPNPKWTENNNLSQTNEDKSKANKDKNNTFTIDKIKDSILFVTIPSLGFYLEKINKTASTPLIFLSKKPIDLPNDEPEKKTKKKKRLENKSRFLLGVNVGGELVAVGLDEFEDWGGKIGIFFEYRYSKKWSGGVGLNFLKKNYEAEGREYSPPVGFWTDAVVPEYTKGTCNILEMPVWVGYYLERKKDSGFYTNVVLNSYFMLEETYNFFYENPDPNLVQKWWGENTSQHWFGIGEISVGYYKSISSRMGIQIAPYFQIPISGVGHGKVKLFSFGVNAKLNFKIK